MEEKVKRYTAFYKDPDDLYKKVQEYFFSYIHGEKGTRTITEKDEDVIPRQREEEYYIRYPEPATITGLCLFLGFSSRQSFYDMSKDKNFKDVIDYASLMIQNKYEIGGLEAKNPTFNIFVLKNMGWADTVNQVIEDKSAPRTTKVEIVRAVDPDEED